MTQLGARLKRLELHKRQGAAAAAVSELDQIITGLDELPTEELEALRDELWRELGDPTEWEDWATLQPAEQQTMARVYAEWVAANPSSPQAA